MDEYLLFHYYSDITRPLDTFTMEEMPTAKDYSDYASLESNVRMVSYSEQYFKRRLRVEKTCKSILEKKCGPVSRRVPIYATLGNEDAIFYRSKHHKFSWAVPISMLDKNQLLFVIGDSIGLSDSIESHCFSYEEFANLRMEQMLALSPSLSDDRYIEVQIWDKKIDELLGNSGAVAYYGCRVNFSQDVPLITFEEKVEELKKQGKFAVFRKELMKARTDLIPEGRIHGIPHSIRCAFLSFCLACEMGLPLEMAAWTAMCAGYHDCGRSFDRREETHADAAIQAIHELFPKEDWEAAYHVIHCHNQSREQIELLPETIGDRPVRLMAKIVHDADSLDYIRFSSEYGMKSFSTEYLVLEEAHKYVVPAYELYMRSMENGWIERIFG